MNAPKFSILVTRPVTVEPTAYRAPASFHGSTPRGLLEAQAELSGLAVDFEDLHVDDVADFDDLAGISARGGS